MNIIDDTPFCIATSGLVYSPNLRSYRDLFSSQLEWRFSLLSTAVVFFTTIPWINKNKRTVTEGRPCRPDCQNTKLSLSQKWTIRISPPESLSISTYYLKTTNEATAKEIAHMRKVQDYKQMKRSGTVRSIIANLMQCATAPLNFNAADLVLLHKYRHVVKIWQGEKTLIFFRAQHRWN